MSKSDTPVFASVTHVPEGWANFSSTTDKFEVKTCATCRYSQDVMMSTDIRHTQAMCARDPDPVTGKPIRLCTTERLVNNPERTVAIKAAEMLNICGPLGAYHLEAELEAPKKRWWQLHK